MRLKTPADERFLQSSIFEQSFGGAEVNVAVSLSLLNQDVRLVSAVPSSSLGDRAIQEIRRWGVKTDHLIQKKGRLGLYYMESGANQRSGQVIYDRSDSVFSELSSESLNWNEIFNGIDWFHISGITPALSQTAADNSLMAMKAAKERGVRISFDLNFRTKLWNYGLSPETVLEPMMELTDVLIAGRGDCQNALNIHGEGDPDSKAYFEALTQKTMSRFPNLSQIAVTIRDTQSAEHHNWAACLRNEDGVAFSRQYEIKDIVDRVGSGDAFSAGLIYALSEEMAQQDALEFAAAACCLKHSVYGDFNLVSAEEISAIASGTPVGRVQR